MAFVAAPNIVQVEIRAILDGQHVENRIYINCLHEPTAADFNNIGNALSGVVSSDWVPLLPTTWVGNEFFLRSLHTQNAIQETIPLPSGSFTGTNINAAMPNNVTLCVSLRSSFAGRSARGRLYWQALTKNQVTESTMNTADANAITAAVQAIDVAMTANGYDWSIVSFVSNKAPRVGGPVYFSINNVLITDFVVDSQRRRLPGRGN